MREREREKEKERESIFWLQVVLLTSLIKNHFLWKGLLSIGVLWLEC